MVVGTSRGSWVVGRGSWVVGVGVGKSRVCEKLQSHRPHWILHFFG